MNMANEKNLKPFKKNDPRINRTGQNRMLVSHVLKELEDKGFEPVTKKEVEKAYMLIIGLPHGELVMMGNDEAQPMLFRIVAKAVLSKSGFDIIERTLDRAHGRPTQPIDPGDKIYPVALVQFEKHVKKQRKTSRRKDKGSR